MRFVIRADAYRMTGAGHVMRSSVIAEELIDRGHEVYFIGNLDEIPWVRQYISNLGFRGIYKPIDQFLTNKMTDILILDSYEISIIDPFIQPHKWRKIFVLVDDTTPSYAGDIYLHAGAETSWKKPESLSSSEFLVGLEYLLIRKSLRKLKSEYIREKTQRMNILISAGGSDPFSFSENIVKILSTLTSNFHAYVLAPEFELPVGDSRFELIGLGKEYESILSVIDLVFTTAGTSSWEYLFLGIPTAVACAADNQQTNHHYLVDNSLAIDIGTLDSKNYWNLDTSFFSKIGIQDTYESKLNASNLKHLGLTGHQKVTDILLKD
jgi:spore coat polysaccharide biosynthesis predicted glycosyltransferase SpsG